MSALRGRGITETTRYTEKAGRLGDPQRWFRCLACGQEWQDPKNRSGDTVSAEHWKVCCESESIQPGADGSPGQAVKNGP